MKYKNLLKVWQIQSITVFNIKTDNCKVFVKNKEFVL